jgi:hypothetical protein
MSLNLIHEEIIDEENVNIADLPESIQRKIKGFNLLYSKYQNNTENLNLRNTLNKNSVVIADEIQNWLEEDFEDEEEDDDNDDNIDNKDGLSSDDKKTSQNKTSEPNRISNTTIPNNSNENKTIIENKNFGNLVMEKKILLILNQNDGRIPIKSLESIIGKEPDYPTQKVNNIVLRKVFLSATYKLV